MRKFRSPVCPFCGKKVNPLLTWSLKKQGEYQCSKCGKHSNIVLDPTVSLFGILAIFFSIVTFLIFKFFVDDVNLLCVILMIIPFLIFNILTLFLVRLKKPVFRKTAAEPPHQNPQSPRSADYHTPTNMQRENIQRNSYNMNQRKM